MPRDIQRFNDPSDPTPTDPKAKQRRRGMRILAMLMLCALVFTGLWIAYQRLQPKEDIRFNAPGTLPDILPDDGLFDHIFYEGHSLRSQLHIFPVQFSTDAPKPWKAVQQSHVGDIHTLSSGRLLEFLHDNGIMEDPLAPDAYAPLRDLEPSLELIGQYDYYYLHLPDAEIVRIIRRAHAADLVYTTLPDDPAPQDSTLDMPSPQGYMLAVPKELNLRDIQIQDLPWNQVHPVEQANIITDHLTRFTHTYGHQDLQSIQHDTVESLIALLDGEDDEQLRYIRYRADQTTADKSSKWGNVWWYCYGRIMTTRVSVIQAERDALYTIRLFILMHMWEPGNQHPREYAVAFHEISSEVTDRGMIMHLMVGIRNVWDEQWSDGYQMMTVHLSGSPEKWSVDDIFYGDTPEVIAQLLSASDYETVTTQWASITQSLSETLDRQCGTTRSSDLPPVEIMQANRVDVDLMRKNMRRRYGFGENAQSALHRDLADYILASGKADPDAAQVYSLVMLTPEFINGDAERRDVTAAVLATTYYRNRKPDNIARLYLVDAKYDEDWQLMAIRSQPIDRIPDNGYQRLQYRSSYELYDVLQTTFLHTIQNTGSVAQPILPQRKTDGAVLDLYFAQGVPRWLHIDRHVRIVADSGMEIPPYLQITDPVDLADDERFQVLGQVDWAECYGEYKGISDAETGLVSISIRLQVESASELMHVWFNLNPDNHYTVATVHNSRTTARHHYTRDPAVYHALMDIFQVDTDVSALMRPEEQGPRLPDDREELRHLVAVVGDMPGGIVRIRPQAEDVLSLMDMDMADHAIESPRDVIQWAEMVGAALDDASLTEADAVPAPLIDGKIPCITLHVDIAPQEGIGQLRIDVDWMSGRIYIQKTYRMYGRSAGYTQVFTTDDEALLDTLMEQTFGIRRD